MRRMMNSKILDLDFFLDMPATARLLYYDLLARADDDGFITPQRVIRMTGASQDDLRVLHGKGFVHVWDDGVLVILHWREHNHVKNDRYVPSDFHARLRDVKGKYALGARETGSKSVPERIQSGSKMVPQDRIGKGREGEVSIENISPLTPQAEKPKKAKELTFSPETQRLWDAFEEALCPITTRHKGFERNELVALVRECGGTENYAKLLRIAQAAHSDRFAPKHLKVSRPSQLRENRGALIVWAKGKTAQHQSEQQESETIRI
jgi:hypothetical protein